MACILVHRRHSTKLVSLTFSRTICRYALSFCPARSWSYCRICRGGASFDILFMYVICICHFLTCTCTIIFGWCGYTNYLWLGNGDIRSIYLFLFQFLFIYVFGVRRPGLWESRTICVYCACLFTVSVYVVIDGYLLIGVWLVRFILLPIRILEVGIGRESAFGVPICIDCLFPTIRRPVPIFGPGGLLSVK